MALAVTAIVAIIAGFFGRRVDPSSSGATTVESVLGESNNSKQQIRVIGVLLALSTVCGLFAQQLESESTQRNTAAKALNQAIIEATQILYSDASNKVQARYILQKLQGQIAELKIVEP